MVTMLMQGDDSDNPEQRGMLDEGGRVQRHHPIHGWQVSSLDIPGHPHPPISITDDMICGEAPGQDSCQGDSGGPFTVEVDFCHDP